MELLDALAQLPKLVTDYQKISAELIEAQRELAALKDDQYVGWDWVCRYLGVERKAARQMLENEKILVYGRKIRKFRRSDIIRFAERHSVRLKSLDA